MAGHKRETLQILIGARQPFIGHLEVCVELLQALGRLDLFGNVPGDFGGACDPSQGVEQRRTRQRHIDQVSALGTPNRLILDSFTLLDAIKYRAHLVHTVGRREGENRTANHFFCRVAENTLSAFVPTGDHAVEVLSDNGIAENSTIEANRRLVSSARRRTVTSLNTSTVP